VCAIIFLVKRKTGRSQEKNKPAGQVGEGNSAAAVRMVKNHCASNIFSRWRLE